MAFSDAFKIFPILNTERLVLRQLTPEDAEVYHHQQMTAQALSGASGAAWSFGGEMESVEKARSWIGFANNAWKKKSRLRWGICLKSDKALIGTCELFDFSNQSKAEIGYWLGAEHQCKGLMSEAITEVVKFGFESMNLHRIYAVTSVSNLPSLRMLEKAGFQQEGILRQHSLRNGVWDDSIIAAILRSDLPG